MRLLKWHTSVWILFFTACDTYRLNRPIPLLYTTTPLLDDAQLLPQTQASRIICLKKFLMNCILYNHYSLSVVAYIPKCSFFKPIFKTRANLACFLQHTKLWKFYFLILSEIVDSLFDTKSVRLLSLPPGFDVL